MLPKGPWGYERSISGDYCVGCLTGYHGGPKHSRGCLTAVVESVFTEVVGALQGELSPGRSDCNDRKCGACSRCRSLAALASVEKLKEGR